MTPEVQKALAALPAEVREYLVDLISLTLGEAPDMDECWSDEWRSVRTTLGRQDRALGSTGERASGFLLIVSISTTAGAVMLVRWWG